MVVYDDTSIEPVRVFDSGVMIRDPETFGEYHLTYRTGDIVSPHIDADRAARARDAGLLRRRPRRRRAARSSAALGLEVVRMIEAVDASLRANGGRVAVDGAPLAA